MLEYSSSGNSWIYYLQRSQYLYYSYATLLKTTCLRVSFTAYKNFYELTEVDNLIGLYPLKDEWIISCSPKTRLVDQMKSSTTEVEMVKRLNGLNIQPEIG